MHELSIALSILDIVAEQAERVGSARVSAVHVQLGPLSGVVREALLSAYDLAREGSDFAETELSIVEVPIRIRCPSCHAEREAVSAQELCCAVCGSPAAEVTAGAELHVTALEVIE